MKKTTPRISKVKFKNGNTISVIPKSISNYKRFDFGWGEVVFRAYDNKDLTISDIYYMCDIAKMSAYEGAQDD